MFSSITPTKLFHSLKNLKKNKTPTAKSNQQDCMPVANLGTRSRSISSATTDWSSHVPRKSADMFISQLKRPQSTDTSKSSSVSSVEYADSIRSCKKMLRHLLAGEGDTAMLEASLTNLIRRSSWPAEALVLRALNRYIAGDWRRSAKDCEDILMIQPDNRFAIVYRSVIYNTRDVSSLPSLREANERARAWASAHPEDRFAGVVACLFPVTQAHYQEAENTLQRLLQKNQGDLCVLSMLMAIYNAWSLQISGVDVNYLEQKALACAQRITQIDPNDVASRALIDWNRRGMPASDGRRILITRPELEIKYPLQMQDSAIGALVI